MHISSAYRPSPAQDQEQSRTRHSRRTGGCPASTTGHSPPAPLSTPPYAGGGRCAGPWSCEHLRSTAGCWEMQQTDQLGLGTRGLLGLSLPMGNDNSNADHKQSQRNVCTMASISKVCCSSSVMVMRQQTADHGAVPWDGMHHIHSSLT